MTANVFTGGFGTDLSSTAPPTTPFTHGQALPLYWEEGNTFGCDPFHASSVDGVVVVYRGECTFLEKLFNAKQAGAQGVVVISDSDKLVTPSANDLELSVTGNVDDVFIVVVGSSDGDRFVELTVQASEAGHGKTFIELVRTPVDEGDESPMPTPTETQTHKTPIQDRYLFLNGIPLTNTRLLV
jgi:mannosidase alpha-like ER degradation enhancer 1